MLLWEAAAELNQLCAARDQGVVKDRVGVLGKEVLASMSELKGRADHPVYYVTSSNLYLELSRIICRQNLQSQQGWIILKIWWKILLRGSVN